MGTQESKTGTTTQSGIIVYDETYDNLIPETPYADTTLESTLSKIISFLVDYTTCVYKCTEVPSPTSQDYIIYFSYNLVDFYIAFPKGSQYASIYKRKYDSEGDYEFHKKYTYENLTLFLNSMLNDVDTLSVLNKL